MTMREALSTPTTLLDWLAAMRDVGNLDPMIIAIREDRLVASGFVSWPPQSAYAVFCGFAADVVACTTDSRIYLGNELPAGTRPESLYAAGHPDAFGALWVQWIPRSGPERIMRRRYRERTRRLEWFDVEDRTGADDMTTIVRTEIVQYALSQCVGTPQPRPELERLTAQHLGMELRT